MVILQYFNMHKEWVNCGKFYDEEMAWMSLGGDDLNYRTFDNDLGRTLTDKRVTEYDYDGNANG